MTSYFRQLLPALILVATPAMAGAQVAAFENLDVLENRLVAALDADIGVPGGPAGPIDRRMKLSRCPTPAQFDPPALGAIAIRCPQLSWRIRVPLMRLANAATPAVRAVPVIRKGDPVQLAVETNGFSVSTEAIAQEDGAPGDRIRVKSDAKASVMIAEVVGIGRVRLPGF